jgi:hypothetical protein
MRSGVAVRMASTFTGVIDEVRRMRSPPFAQSKRCHGHPDMSRK